MLRHLAKHPHNHVGLFCLCQKSRCTTGSEPNVRGTQASTEIVDSLSENQEHGNGDQVREAPRASPGWFQWEEPSPVSPFAGSVLLCVAELYWRSSSPAMALPVLLQALALSKEYRLQYLASETVLNLAFAQVSRCLFFFSAHVCTQELARLALLFGFEKDSNELSFLTIEVWACSLHGEPSREVGSCEHVDTSQGHWPCQAAALSQGDSPLH